jgi:chromosome segregation ATPase
MSSIKSGRLEKDVLEQASEIKGLNNKLLCSNNNKQNAIGLVRRVRNELFESMESEKTNSEISDATILELKADNTALMAEMLKMKAQLGKVENTVVELNAQLDDEETITLDLHALLAVEVEESSGLRNELAEKTADLIELTASVQDIARLTESLEALEVESRASEHAENKVVELQQTNDVLIADLEDKVRRSGQRNLSMLVLWMSSMDVCVMCN